MTSSSDSPVSTERKISNLHNYRQSSTRARETLRLCGTTTDRDQTPFLQPHYRRCPSFPSRLNSPPLLLESVDVPVTCQLLSGGGTRGERPKVNFCLSNLQWIISAEVLCFVVGTPPPLKVHILFWRPGVPPKVAKLPSLRNQSLSVSRFSSGRQQQVYWNVVHTYIRRRTWCRFPTRIQSGFFARPCRYLRSRSYCCPLHAACGRARRCSRLLLELQ